MRLYSPGHRIGTPDPANYYHDGAVYFQDSELHVMGEAVRVDNNPMAMKATLPLLHRNDLLDLHI